MHRKILAIDEIYEFPDIADRMECAWICFSCKEVGICTQEMDYCNKCGRLIDKTLRDMSTIHGQVVH